MRGSHKTAKNKNGCFLCSPVHKDFALKFLLIYATGFVLYSKHNKRQPLLLELSNILYIMLHNTCKPKKMSLHISGMWFLSRSLNMTRSAASECNYHQIFYLRTDKPRENNRIKKWSVLINNLIRRLSWKRFIARSDKIFDIVEFEHFMIFHF